MRRLASLNFRLALILFLALGASYSLMTWLLHDRLREVRVDQFAQSVAAQIRQVEAQGPGVPSASPPEFANGRGFGPGPGEPPFDGRGDRGRHGAGMPPPYPHEHGNRHEPIDRLQAALASSLGQPVELRPGFDAGHRFGLWVRVARPDARWIWVVTPPPVIHGIESLVLVPAVGFFLVFAAGIYLVMQVNRPLQKLGDALAQVGERTAPAPLPLRGAAEIRSLTERFNNMVARLARMEVERATMLAGVAHDLRTPLTRLQLQIELADGPRKDSMLRDLAQLGDIIDHFRLFAGGGSAEAAEPRDLALLLEEALEGYRERGLVLDLRASATVKVRPAALRRALSNLVDNAYEYGVPPVTVRVVVGASECAVEVMDCGPGIPPERIADALRPFSRLDPARGGSGHSGLGLAIVDRLMSDQGGRLELGKAPSGGLLARLVLPPA